MRRPRPLAPSARDPVVATAAQVIGGPAGRHLALGVRGLRGVVAALVPLSAALLALGVFQKGHCLVKGWVNPDQFWRACYSDVTVVHVTTSLSARQLPWVGEGGSDQPLVSGLVMGLLARISPRAGTDLPAQQWIFVLWALLALLALLVATAALVALRPDRPWQAAHLAVAPVLALLALVSVDLVGVTLVALGLLAWARDRPATAGVLLGLATLVRPYALVFLAAAVLVGVRAQERGRVQRLLTGAVLTVVGLVVPFAVAEPATLGAVRSWLTTGAGYGSPVMLPQLLGAPLQPGTTTAIALAGWALALGLGWWLTQRSRHRTGLVGAAAVMLLVVALTAKAVPVQTGLWVLPLLALSSIRWRDHLVWAAAEALHFLAVWLHIGFGSDAGKGLPPDAYALVVLVRAAGWAWVCWQVWRHTTAHVGSR